MLKLKLKIVNLQPNFSNYVRIKIKNRPALGKHCRDKY